MPDSSPRVATAEDYSRLFEGSPTGELVLEDLVRRFARGPVTKGGIDAILQTYLRAGSRDVIEFITARINEAHGVQPTAEEQGT